MTQNSERNFLQLPLDEIRKNYTSKFGTHDALRRIDEVNKTATESENPNVNQALIMTLSTTVMMARKKPLPKEYYQWTRCFLRNIRNDDGKPLPNISQFLKAMDSFERENNIEDELLSDKTDDNMPFITIEQASDGYEDEVEDFNSESQVFSSTKNPPVSQEDNASTDDTQEKPQDNRESEIFQMKM